MTCSEQHHCIDWENDKGISGHISLSKELFDEEDRDDLVDTVLRVIDAWMKRREFVHRNIQHYKKLC